MPSLLNALIHDYDRVSYHLILLHCLQRVHIILSFNGISFST